MARFRNAARQPWLVMPLLGVVFVTAWFTVGPGNARGSTSTATDTERLVTATNGSLATTVSAQGTIAHAQTADLDFTAAGTVTAVDVVAGQKVTTGAVLATIDSPALVLAFDEASATEASAAAALSDDKAAGASSAQIAADTTRVTSAQDALAAAYAGLAAGQLVATFDGTVASVNLTVGEQLTASGSGGNDNTGSATGRSSSSLGSGNEQSPTGSSNSSSSATAQISVVSAGSYTVDVGLDASDVAKVAAGQQATITLTTAGTSRFGFPGGIGGFGAFPGGGSATSGNGATANGSTTNSESGTRNQAIAGTASATGTVTSVGATADASSGVATYPVTVSFTDDTGQYNAGATVDVSITVAEQTDVVLVPAFAVTTTNGTSTVVVSTNGKKETRSVTTGERSGAEIAILSGLKAGEQVVISFPSGGPGAGFTTSGSRTGGAPSAPGP